MQILVKIVVPKFRTPKSPRDLFDAKPRVIYCLTR